MRHARRLVALALAACVLAGAMPLHVVAHAQDDPRSPAVHFGAAGAFADPAVAASLGVTWALLPFEWAALQPEPGAALDLSALDTAALDALHASGIAIVGMITRTPAWASDSGSPIAVPQGLERPYDDAGNLWGQFVAALVAETAPWNITQWVLYDQPDVQIGEGRAGFAGDEDAYARLIAVAAQAAQSVEPNTSIVTGALVGWTDRAAGREPYLARLLRVLQARDSVGYLGGVLLRVADTTGAVWDLSGESRAVLDAAGVPGIPIWLVAQTGASGANAVTRAQQADFVVQAAAAALALDVQYVAVEYTHAAPAHWWGVVHMDRLVVPAFEAYRVLVGLLAGVQDAAAYRTDSADVVRVLAPEHELYVLWARGEDTASVTITAPEVGETGWLYSLPDAHAAPRAITAAAVEWPAAYVIEAPAAQRDANGFLRVAGPPRVLVLARADDFYRVVYADVGAERVRLR